MAGAGSQPKP